jgi:hypothetical protein
MHACKICMPIRDILSVLQRPVNPNKTNKINAEPAFITKGVITNDTIYMYMVRIDEVFSL